MAETDVDLAEIPVDPESSDRVASDWRSAVNGEGPPQPSAPDAIAGSESLEIARPGEREIRRHEVEAKHRRLIAFMEQGRFEAVVLCRSDSLAWFTAGGDLSRDLSAELGAAAIFVTRQSRAVICDNVQSGRIFEQELDGLGFLLKERPWHAEPFSILAELGRGRRVAGDVGLYGTENQRWPLLRLRLVMESSERERMRSLGADLARAVEAVAREIQPGWTEPEVAALLAAHLVRSGIAPLSLRVAGDGRTKRHREPIPKPRPFQRSAVLIVSGRRQGLCASVSRTVAFGQLDESNRQAHALATMVQATELHFSRPGETVGEIFRRARRILEKYAAPNEWQLAYQGRITGYSRQEVLLTPQSQIALQPGLALTWCPSVGPARGQDTMIVGDPDPEVVTEVIGSSWPRIEVQVKGQSVTRPAILVRR